jgi:hypothetical protein
LKINKLFTTDPSLRPSPASSLHHGSEIEREICIATSMGRSHHGDFM